ncbi:hypothetical protein BPO_0043 [Bergeyella porcorum]|uniref:Uncharacterized protein n=1 Tax=Bergeyella porcorum TaxID=1735111 RepID=A0AAU0F035_9FLAO
MESPDIFKAAKVESLFLILTQNKKTPEIIL